MKPQAIVCDRDGTLIEDCHFLSSPEQIQWIPGVLETLTLLNQLNVKVLVVTNQSGVARGYFDATAVEAVHTQLRRDVEGISGAIADFYYCPHHPNGQAIGYSYACDCRKPSPGMFLQAIRDHGLHPAQCWAIGDRLRDLEPGLQLGMKGFLVKTGSGVQAQQELSQRPYAQQITVISSLSEILYLMQSDSNCSSAERL
jgi:D-glycero-D-manno-heptose 1,7-bisphosphate phosphatase